MWFTEPKYSWRLGTGTGIGGGGGGGYIIVSQLVFTSSRKKERNIWGRI